ncbi:TrbI/VirB10 family protein, partial [Pseudomonas aeruginosa]|uniref:TrbI/VirB10 family protein n=1 Tax=Pseudomonas aeruginosa TaxID=287 RepID=UPI0030047996
RIEVDGFDLGVRTHHDGAPLGKREPSIRKRTAQIKMGFMEHLHRIIIAGRDSVQDSVNQVGQEMTRRNMNIQPTLTERPGLPVRIIVNRDLVLRPYQPLFFNRRTSQ